MLSETNKGFYGLGPLNQAAIQAAGIFVSPLHWDSDWGLNYHYFGGDLNLHRFKSLDLAISQKNWRGMENYH